MNTQQDNHSVLHEVGLNSSVGRESTPCADGHRLDPWSLYHTKHIIKYYQLFLCLVPPLKIVKLASSHKILIKLLMAMDSSMCEMSEVFTIGCNNSSACGANPDHY